MFKIKKKPLVRQKTKRKNTEDNTTKVWTILDIIIFVCVAKFHTERNTFEKNLPNIDYHLTNVLPTSL